MSKHTMIYLQPTPVRIWHWLNALGIVTLCITGAQIRFPEYLAIFGSYKTAILLHNTAGIVVAVSFSLWFFYYKMIAGTLLKLYVPNQEELQHGLLRQAIFYFFRYFRGDPSPHHATPDNKFNPMQKSAYLAIMFVLMPLVSLTGILLMNVTPLRELVLLSGGLKILVSGHFLLASSLCAFLFTHVYLATLGHSPMAHIKPMWTGWEEAEEHGEVKQTEQGNN
ncbi:cytochrome b/b6 domain-containing protein [Geotalea uraniireducens]|uniref:Cytochrome B561 n=1 Tax=Geotalea uraniireducens (strain Rf4) TaxID=351605 RepID=A5G519_GEOUR|nr:cytochrome b/b6 domain-containing protein [Geotalea uraniireducens]ABQ26887.1 cytochrome B561 [Geotalea uraniireducens Rf4]